MSSLISLLILTIMLLSSLGFLFTVLTFCYCGVVGLWRYQVALMLSFNILCGFCIEIFMSKVKSLLKV
jgi:hypothetical protein